MPLALLSLLAVAAAPPPRVVADSPLTTKPFAGPAGVHAFRAAQPVIIDGVLDDAVWQTAERISGFKQQQPNEGAAVTESTVVWVAYDDAALYVAARLYDAHPDSIIARLARRDNSVGSDEFTVFIDSYHDRRSGFYFVVSAAGIERDGTMYNDDWTDDSWDGVWEAKTRVDSAGWTAEIRIPYSQLRFRKSDQYVWGINFRRFLARRQEFDYLVYRPLNGSGFVSRFPDLTGIAQISPPARVEVLPYTTGKAEYAPHAAGDPFNSGSRYTPGLGADFRLGVGGNLTLNGTINPDFGQVEVDPAVVNLSAFETFFNEKRPFFVEGSSIFNFGRGGARNYWSFNWFDPQFFYSRRIGRPPEGGVPTGSNSDSSFSDVPSATPILGAVKLTGKLGGDWNVGALSALTAREVADVDTSGVRFRREVEPLAYYGVYRAQKEFPEGRQGLGVMTTVMARSLDDSVLDPQFDSRAVTGGIDGWTFLDQKKSWVLTGWAGATDVSGSAARITALQEQPAHYFQRPDAKHVRVDSAATSLTGWGTRIYLNKQQGDWFSNSAFGILSPGFDVGDVGFMNRAGVMNAHVGAGRGWSKPGKVFQYVETGASVFRNWDSDYETDWTGVYWFSDGTFRNYYSFNVDWAYNPRTINATRTRGGPVSVNMPGYQWDVNMMSDSRRALQWGFSTGVYQSVQDRNWYFGPMLQWQPTPAAMISFMPQYSYDNTPVQYVGTYVDSTNTATFGNDYDFARLRQNQVSAAIQLNWTFSPTLSLQLYAQPLISAGKYDNFVKLARPRSFAFDSIAAPYDPDFNFKSLRGNAVLRWEYLPGSTLFVVWTQARSDYENQGDFAFGNSLHRLALAPADNIFLVKLSYWWNP